MQSITMVAYAFFNIIIDFVLYLKVNEDDWITVHVIDNWNNNAIYKWHKCVYIGLLYHSNFKVSS